MAFDPFAGGDVFAGVRPSSPAEAIAGIVSALRALQPLLHTVARVEIAAGVAVWLAFLVLPARNPWWRWTGWFVLAGTALSFLTIQYLPVIDYLVSRGAGR